MLSFPLTTGASPQVWTWPDSFLAFLWPKRACKCNEQGKERHGQNHNFFLLLFLSSKWAFLKTQTSYPVVNWLLCWLLKFHLQTSDGCCKLSKLALLAWDVARDPVKMGVSFRRLADRRWKFKFENSNPKLTLNPESKIEPEMTLQLPTIIWSDS